MDLKISPECLILEEKIKQRRQDEITFKMAPEEVPLFFITLSERIKKYPGNHLDMNEINRISEDFMNFFSVK